MFLLYLYKNVLGRQENYIDSSPLKMGQIDGTETSVRNYPYSLHNNSDYPSSQLLRVGRLKSHKCSTNSLISQI